jgi:hypothetical protein
VAYVTNKSAFAALSCSCPAVNSYAILVRIELALKDGNCRAQRGHDVPTMLEIAALLNTAPPAVAPQLRQYATRLRTDLSAIRCQGLGGIAAQVNAGAYPDLRYVRHAGDWGGVDETSQHELLQLMGTCSSICQLLLVHGKTFGVVV